MKQGRKSRRGYALLSALAAVVAVVAIAPMSAIAAPAAVDEYELALPTDDGPQDPVPAPEPVPEPEPSPAPSTPAPSSGLATEEAAPTEATAAGEPRRLDRLAVRRDVLFDAPAQPAETPSLAAPVEDGSLPPALWLLFGLGGACIVATLLRLRRFAAGLATAPRAVPSSQTSA